MATQEELHIKRCEHKLDESFKRYGQGHCDQSLLTSKRLLSLQLSRLRRSTQTSWLRAVGVYKAVQRSNPHTKQHVNGRRPSIYTTYLDSTSNIPIFHNFIATIAFNECFGEFRQLHEPIRTINLAISWSAFCKLSSRLASSWPCMPYHVNTMRRAKAPGSGKHVLFGNCPSLHVKMSLMQSLNAL